MTELDPAAFRRGDPAVFGEAVHSFSPRLLALLLRYASSESDARDLLQTTWMKAFRQRRSFLGRGSLLGWLMTIARNVARDALRAHVPGRETPLSGETRAEETGPDGLAERAALGRDITEALFELGDRQREVVVLRLLEGRSVRETAKVLGCAEGTVKATLHQALRKMETRLQEWNR